MALRFSMINHTTSQVERNDGSDRHNQPSFCALIINPSSGGYEKEKVAVAVAALERSGLTAELFIARSVEDIESCSRRICARHERPLLIAGGGDGTVNGVLNGLSSSATLALLPLGTSNVLAAELAITSIDDAVDKIVRGKTRPLSVGLLSSGERQRYFFLMAGIGVDGSVVERVGATGKRLLGKGAYCLSVLRCLLCWEREKLAVVLDGIEEECHSVIVCNAAHYGGAFRLAPGTDISSSRFEVICIKSDKRRTYAKLALHVIAGKGIFKEEMLRFPAHDVVISGRKPVQIDGDFFGFSPVTIRMVSGYARIIV